MSHSTIYRICLLVVVILTIIGGIFYYVNYMEHEIRVTDGTLVRRTAQELSVGRMEGQEYMPSCFAEGQNLSVGLRDRCEKAVA